MTALKKGLHTLPADVVDGIVADYDSFFEEGLRAGRSETNLLDALGNPARLAAELRLAVSGEQFRADRTARSALRTFSTAFGLVLADALLLLPVSVLLLTGAALALCVAVGLLYGLYLLVLAPFATGAGAALLFTGIGFLSGAVAGGAALLLISGFIVKWFTRYGRMHSRLLLLPPDPRSSAKDVST